MNSTGLGFTVPLATVIQPQPVGVPTFMNGHAVDIAVVCRQKPASRIDMSNTHRFSGTVEVDRLQYDWELRREPQWSDLAGWKGMAALLQKDTQREAVLEFPPPKRLLKGLPPSRLQINDALVSRGIRAALLAGWDPMSRGKPMVFLVDADGN
jgi:hypothetical protein